MTDGNCIFRMSRKFGKNRVICGEVIVAEAMANRFNEGDLADNGLRELSGRLTNEFLSIVR